MALVYNPQTGLLQESTTSGTTSTGGSNLSFLGSLLNGGSTISNPNNYNFGSISPSTYGAVSQGQYLNPQQSSLLSPILNTGAGANTSGNNLSQSGQYYKIGTDVYGPQGHIDLPTFQKLGLNFALLPSRTQSPTQNADITGGNQANGGTDQSGGVDYSALINSMTGNQQAQSNLNNAPMDMLQKIFDMMGQSGQSQTPDILGYLTQARQDAGLPQLQNQYLDVTGKLNALNQSLYDAEGKINTTPDLTQFQMGARENALTRASNPLIGQLQAQQQTLGAQMGVGQQNVAQGLGAATSQAGLGFQQQQLQQQRQLGLAGLGLQAVQLPAQNQLLTAQAQQAQAQAGFYKNIYGGLDQTGGNSGTRTGVGALPQFLQGAVTQDINGQGYIVESRVPSLGGLGTDAAKSYAGRLGVPILTDAQAQSIAGLDTTQNNLASLQQLINPTSQGGQGLLGSGLGGKLQGVTLNNLEKALGIGNGPLLTQIDSFRESAIKQIQGLASGGTGLRINQAEINSAIQNLPTTSDNIETANAKMQQLSVFFANQRSAIFALGGLKSSFHALTNQGAYSW